MESIHPSDKTTCITINLPFSIVSSKLKAFKYSEPSIFADEKAAAEYFNTTVAAVTRKKTLNHSEQSSGVQ